MSFSGLILTNLGRNELIRAELGATFNITHIILGDGTYTGAYTAIQNVVNPIIEMPVTHVYRDGEEVYIECDFDSTEMPEAFYLREIGIIANDVLCYYDNAREDAEFIDPASETLVKQKRMRFVLLISSEIQINVSIKSSLYALATDLIATQENLTEHIENTANPHQVTKEQVGLGNVNNTADMDKPISTAVQKALDLYYEQSTAYSDKAVAELVNGAPETMDTLKEVSEALAENEDVVEILNAAIGAKANQTEVDTHTGNNTIHITASERAKWNGKLSTTDSTNTNTITFTSNDTLTPDSYTDISIMESGQTHSLLFNKISTMFKNIRYIWGVVSNLVSLYTRQSFSDVGSAISASVLNTYMIRNSNGNVLGFNYTPNTSYILFCQYRGNTSSPAGASVWSLKVSEAQSVAELLMSTGTTYPEIRLTTPNMNAYIARSSGEGTCEIDVAVLKIR